MGNQESNQNSVSKEETQKLFNKYRATEGLHGVNMSPRTRQTRDEEGSRRPSGQAVCWAGASVSQTP